MEEKKMCMLSTLLLLRMLAAFLRGGNSSQGLLVGSLYRVSISSILSSKQLKVGHTMNRIPCIPLIHVWQLLEIFLFVLSLIVVVP